MRKPITPLSLVAFGLLASATLLGGLYFARQSGTDPHVYNNDFNVFYHAASEVLAGRDPYQSSLTEWTPYLYPPLLSQLMVPLAALPLSIAAYVWFVIGVLSVAVAARMSADLSVQTRTDSEPERALAQTDTALIAFLGILFLIRFALDNINLGQVNTIVGALSVAHVYFYAKNRKALSAAAFVFAASIKLTPVVLIVYHIAKLRLKFAAACLILLAAVTALSFLQFGSRGPETFGIFFNRTVKNEQGFDLAYAGNQSLRGAVARVFEDNESAENSARKPTSSVTLFVSILLVAFATLAARRARNDAEAAAPLFCCFVILSPLSWKTHFIVLILPVVYLICRALQKSEKRRAYLIAALAASFALFNMTSPKVVGLRAAEWADAHSLVLAGALVLFIACVWQALHRFVTLNQSD